jgi:hypothetical protein
VDAGAVIDQAFLEALRWKFGERPSLFAIQWFTFRLYRIYKVLNEDVSLDDVDGTWVEMVKMLTVGVSPQISSYLRARSTNSSCAQRTTPSRQVIARHC